MSHENQNPNQNPFGGNFWEFIRSMDNLGIDPNGPPPPPNGAHPPPPPHGAPPHDGPPPPPPGHGSHPPPPPPGVGAGFPHGPAGNFMQFPFDQSAFGGWGWGGRGRHGHGYGREPRGHGLGHERRRNRSRTPSSSGDSRSRSASPQPEAAVREEEERQRERERPSSPRGDRGPQAHPWEGRRGRRGCHGRAGRPPFPFGSFHRGWQGPGPHGHHSHHRGPLPPQAWDPTTSPQFLRNLASNPFIARVLEQIALLNPQMNTQNNGEARNGTEGAESNDGTFTPATDIFTTPTAYTLHIALPGAKKEDIGVHYSATTSTLTISGVIYRPGSEEFLATMTSSERKVGMFEKNVVLKGDDGGEVDGEGITAKLEDGVLVVTVPKVEKEWEDVKRVDIE